MGKTAVFEGGGSGYRAAEVSDGRIIMLAELPVSAINPNSLIAFIGEQAKKIGAASIGVSTSGFITPAGVITHSTNTGLPDDFPLQRLITEVTGLPARVLNDLVAAIRGVASFVFPDLKHFILANVGGGVGQNEYDDGLIKFIDERGHMKIDLSPFAMFCACGRQGCAESIIGGRSLTRRVEWVISALNLKKPAALSPCAFLDQEFIAGQAWALTTYAQFAQGLGVYLGNLLLGNPVKTIVFRGTTVTRALAFPSVDAWTRAALASVIPDKSWLDLEFRFVTNRPDLPKDYDAFYGAAAFARDAAAPS